MADTSGVVQVFGVKKKDVQASGVFRISGLVSCIDSCFTHT